MFTWTFSSLLGTLKSKGSVSNFILIAAGEESNLKLAKQVKIRGGVRGRGHAMQPQWRLFFTTNISNMLENIFQYSIILSILLQLLQLICGTFPELCRRIFHNINTLSPSSLQNMNSDHASYHTAHHWGPRIWISGRSCESNFTDKMRCWRELENYQPSTPNNPHFQNEISQS